jgi:tungstate transport system substrate-binding protein
VILPSVPRVTQSRCRFVKPVALLALTALLNCQPREPSVTIATTTSLEGSGLLQVIRVEVKRQTGILVKAFVVGSGRALRMASQGDVDLTITHDPDAERTFVAEHKPELYRQFMWNDFVIVGPQSDPAGISRMPSAADAFRRLYDSRSKFLSRSDQSGTHMKEIALWRAANVAPAANPNYLPMGQPMAHLLRSADELQAYALSDRATFDQLAPSLHIGVVFAGDPTLRNTYAVMLMRRPDSDEHRNAKTFARWLLSPEGRHVVESFRIRGHRELHWME